MIKIYKNMINIMLNKKKLKKKNYKYEPSF